MPENFTVAIGGGADVPPGETMTFFYSEADMVDVSGPWTDADYMRCWQPIGTLRTGAWADNGGSIGGAGVAPYDHERFLEGLPQIGTTMEQPCTVSYEGEYGGLMIEYTVTNDPDIPKPWPSGYINPSSITGTVDVTWVRK